jgi:hypothetical protein
MLKLMLAAVIVIFLIVPELLVTGTLFAVDDGFGCRGCFRCGATIIPVWANYVGFSLVIGGLTFLGVRELVAKKE